MEAGILAFYGVEVFFVLSGFLIGSILLSLRPSFKNLRVLPTFWQRRWFRTLPNYFLFLVINIIFFLLGSLKLPNLLPYFLFLQNWLWVQPHFFAETWSLAVEEWFYLLFPIAIFAFHQRLNYEKALVISALVFLIIPTTLRVVWAFSGHNNWDEEFRKVAVLRLDSIMYGVLAAYIKIAFPVFWKKAKQVSLLTGLGILVAAWHYLVETGFNTWVAKTILFSAISLGAAFLLPFCDQWQVLRENMITHSFRRIALWSYSLYLCSLTISLIINIIYLSSSPNTLLASLAAGLAFFGLSFVISASVYHYFEKPMMDLRERF